MFSSVTASAVRLFCICNQFFVL